MFKSTDLYFSFFFTLLVGLYMSHANSVDVETTNESKSGVEPFSIPIRVILIPGNGQTVGSYGLPDTAAKLRNVTIDGKPVFEVVNGPWPDPQYARSKYWMPYILQNFVEGNTIIAGASSGALAVMRTMEVKKVLIGFILSGTTDPNGDPDEILSGWYPPQGGDWQFKLEAINAQSIWQFGGDNDPYCAFWKQLIIHNSLPGSTLVRYPFLAGDDAHLGDDENILNIIMNQTAPHLPPFSSSCGFELPAYLPETLDDGSRIVTVNTNKTSSNQ